MPAPQFEELTLEKLETFLLRLADDRRTGKLQIQGEGARGGRVDLREGKIVGVDSPFSSETIGEIARKLGFLQIQDVQKAVDALSRSENAGKQLPDILLEEKLLSPQGLEACLRYQAEAAMHSMIGFHGRISFMPGHVAASEITLEVRAVLKRLKERDHVEEMGSAFLGIVPPNTAETGTQADGAPAPEIEAQNEMRRIAQEAIREAALGAADLQAELDAQASGAAEQLLADAPRAPVSEDPGLAWPADAQEPPPDLPPDAIDLAAIPDVPDRPRLARVCLEICRPGESSTDALLGYAIHFAKRAVLFAATSKGLKLAGSRTREGVSFANEDALKSLLLPMEPKAAEPDSGPVPLVKHAEGMITRAFHERVPLRGAFVAEDEADKLLAEAVGDAPEGETIFFPIALHERAIGLLYGDGVPEGDPGLLEGLAAAVAVTAVVMENKLLTRLSKK